MNNTNAAAASTHAVFPVSTDPTSPFKSSAKDRPRTCSTGVLGLSVNCHEVRDLLRAPTAPPVGGGLRAPADPGRAGSGGAGRQARLPYGVGGRAPLPRGVLAFLGARGVSGRRVATDQ